MSDWFGTTICSTNFFAESMDDEDATAATLWTMSLTSRVFGSMRRSLVNVWAIPPVAVEGLIYWMEVVWRLTHDAPTNDSRFRHDGFWPFQSLDQVLRLCKWKEAVVTRLQNIGVDLRPMTREGKAFFRRSSTEKVHSRRWWYSADFRRWAFSASRLVSRVRTFR